MESEISLGTLAELASALGGELDGPADLRVMRPVPAGSDDPAGITFAEGEKYYEAIRASQVGAVILPPSAPDLGRPSIRVASPRRSFGQVLAMAEQPLSHAPGIHPTAVIHPAATIDPTASIGPNVVIGAAEVGPGTVIHAHAFVGDRCRIGKNCILYPRVTLVMNVEIGDECILHPGVVLGADGFGYAWNGQEHQKIPQVGRVRLGNRVEIGANSTIDRATCGETLIGSGVKIDNLVMIAHNCTIGDHCVMASQVGIAGSATVGRGVVMGGQAAVADHVSVVDGAQLAARTGVTTALTQPGTYFGTPATPFHEAMRQIAATRKLPELLKAFRALTAAKGASKES